MPSVPKRPLYRGSTLKNFLAIWKAGEIKPNTYGFAGGLSGRLQTPQSLAHNRSSGALYGVGVRDYELFKSIPVVVYFKPDLRKDLTKVKYTENFFKKNLPLAVYVRDTPAEIAFSNEAHRKDSISGAVTFRREQEFVSDKPIPVKQTVQKVQVFLTPEALEGFTEELRNKSRFFRDAGFEGGYFALPSPQSRHKYRKSSKRLAFLVTALTARIARQLKGVPLEVFYGRPDLKKLRPMFTTSGEVPKMRPKDFALFLPNMKWAKWGIFNPEEGFSIAYGQTLTKPEAEKTAKRYEKELGKPLVVKKLTKGDTTHPIYL